MLYRLLKAIGFVLLHIFYRFRIYGQTELPEGRLILCSNHINLMDPIVLAAIFKRRVNYMAKKELFENRFLAWLLPRVGAFPVDRKNNDMKSIRTSIKILKEDKVLGIFPEGTRVTTVSPNNIKQGVGMLAARTVSNIQPVRIVSEYKLFRPVEIYIRPIIEIKDFDLSNPEINKQLSMAVYQSIYEISEDTDEN